jgi:hypothetical protein
MVLIQVPKVPDSAVNPNRTANALLVAQVMHFREAERALPAKYHTDTYVNAIRTESEASEYIAAVTAAVHQAHEEAAARRVRKVSRRGVVKATAAEKPPKRRTKKPSNRKVKRNK